MSFWLIVLLFVFASEDFSLRGAEAKSAEKSPGSQIDWQAWNDSVFVQARREHKFVLLDLQAVWCHWCHVMDAQTYSDPQVIALTRAHYIAVRVDQDSRPDLASRYQDYGWPATIVFNENGGEIVKRQGFLPPRQMSSMLQAIIDDPTPGPSVTSPPVADLSATPGSVNAAALRQQLDDGYDHALAGWGRGQKFLNWDNVEYCLIAAQRGDKDAEQMARQTLKAQLNLIDPVWGGVDQYSAEGDWNHPHFEKIMQMQAENLRIYAGAYAQWKDPAYLQTALGIYRYVRLFLTSPDGVVYVSQDADLVDGVHAADYFKLDDVERRKLGIPHVDQHIYARENGWFCVALTHLYAATGDTRYRDEAARAASWIIGHRALSGGGFGHGDTNSGPISLGDNLAMGRAFLALYAITGDQTWLDHAEATAAFIDAHFPFRVKDAVLGYAAFSGEPVGSIIRPEPDFDENVNLARFANLLFQYSQNPRDRGTAENALRFVNRKSITESRLSSVGGLILAREESASAPLHIAVVGAKSDRDAQALFAAAAAFPVAYKQVEWIDQAGPVLPADAALYPKSPAPAAYLCVNQACSAPVSTPQALTALLQRRTTAH